MSCHSQLQIQTPEVNERTLWLTWHSQVSHRAQMMQMITANHIPFIPCGMGCRQFWAGCHAAYIKCFVPVTGCMSVQLCARAVLSFTSVGNETPTQRHQTNPQFDGTRRIFATTVDTQSAWTVFGLRTTGGSIARCAVRRDGADMHRRRRGSVPFQWRPTASCCWS